MKSLLIFGMFLALTVAGASEPQKPRVDGHSDGKVRLPVAIRVSDALSGAPISDVRITFYDEVALVILTSIDAAQKKGRTPENTIPTGVVARTSQDGRAAITCRFDAAFLWSFEMARGRMSARMSILLAAL
ncbi:MAG TPA: hypothetical protein PLN52_24285 [Opitutaceae bacterium]|nr:hypothetical protein [Opitutaceae bacterium]